MSMHFNLTSTEWVNIQLLSRTTCDNLLVFEPGQIVPSSPARIMLGVRRSHLFCTYIITLTYQSQMTHLVIVIWGPYVRLTLVPRGRMKVILQRAEVTTVANPIFEKRNTPFVINYCRIWATTWQNQQNECAPSKDSDHPGYPPSLIRVVAVRLMCS